jgi:hypothetical protein
VDDNPYATPLTAADDPVAPVEQSGAPLWIRLAVYVQLLCAAVWTMASRASMQLPQRSPPWKNLLLYAGGFVALPVSILAAVLVFIYLLHVQPRARTAVPLIVVEVCFAFFLLWAMLPAVQ